MKLPRGFAKNYFSLSSITATVNSVTMHQRATVVQDFHMHGASYPKEDDTSELSEELESPPCLEILTPTTGCHCNCFFLSYTKRILTLLDSAKKGIYYYRTINSSISPPLYLIVNSCIK